MVVVVGMVEVVMWGSIGGEVLVRWYWWAVLLEVMGYLNMVAPARVRASSIVGKLSSCIIL